MRTSLQPSHYLTDSVVQKIALSFSLNLYKKIINIVWQILVKSLCFENIIAGSLQIEAIGMSGTVADETTPKAVSAFRGRQIVCKILIISSSFRPKPDTLF